jgi:DNA-directed RNA polymerase alpha subunit
VAQHELATILRQYNLDRCCRLKSQMHVSSPSLNDTFTNDALASDEYLRRLNLSVRARNILLRLGIKSDEELAQIKHDVLMRQRNCGKKTVAEIMDLIETLPPRRVNLLRLKRTRPDSIHRKPLMIDDKLQDLGELVGMADS